MLSQMGALMNEYLQHGTVKKFLKLDAAGKSSPKFTETHCERVFAGLYYKRTNKGMWEESRYLTLFLVFAFLPLVCHTFLHRKFLWPVTGSNDDIIAIYLVGELLSWAIFLLQARMKVFPHHFYIRNRLLITLLTAVSIGWNAYTIIVSSKINFESDIDRAHFVAIIFKGLHDLYKPGLEIRELYRLVVTSYPQADRTYGIPKVLLKNDPNEDIIWATMPIEVKLWATKSLMHEGSRIRRENKHLYTPQQGGFRPHGSEV